MASEAGRWCTVPWARKGRAGELGNKPVGIRDGWVRWTGCAAVREAAGLCVAEGTRSRLKPTLALTWPYTLRGSTGDIHTNWLGAFYNFTL